MVSHLHKVRSSKGVVLLCNNIHIYIPHIRDITYTANSPGITWGSCSCPINISHTHRLWGICMCTEECRKGTYEVHSVTTSHLYPTPQSTNTINSVHVHRVSPTCIRADVYEREATSWVSKVWRNTKAGYCERSPYEQVWTGLHHNNCYEGSTSYTSYTHWCVQLLGTTQDAWHVRIQIDQMNTHIYMWIWSLPSSMPFISLPNSFILGLPSTLMMMSQTFTNDSLVHVFIK